VSIATAEETQTIPQTVSIGDQIMTRHGNFVWEGEHAVEGMEAMIAHMRKGEVGFEGSPSSVAPLAVEVLVNLKDPRISVTKQPENRPVSWVGPWAAVIAGEEEYTNPSWHRTKKEGVAETARRLAVRDWHANGGVVNV